jgi:hypothetical protein
MNFKNSSYLSDIQDIRLSVGVSIGRVPQPVGMHLNEDLARPRIRNRNLRNQIQTYITLPSIQLDAVYLHKLQSRRGALWDDRRHSGGTR